MIAGIFLALVSIVWGYTVFAYGGVVPWERTIALGALGVVALSYRLAIGRNAAPSLTGVLRWSLLSLPAYAALQVIPLPVRLISILSPSRGELIRAFAVVGG